MTKPDPRPRLAGLHAALPTPYDADGAVSPASLRRVIAHVTGLGLDGIYVGGSTGEFLLQSIEERIAVLETARAAAGDLVVIGQVGAPGTREAAALASRCADLGYDAVSAIPPIYFPYGRDEIVRYYADIIEAARGVPVIVYNIPNMSGVRFGFDDLLALLSLPGVAGVKQTANDMYEMERLRRALPGLVILNGFDEMLLAGLASGANGAIGSTFNILGDRYVALRRALAAGDVAGARAIQSAANTVIDELCRVGVFPGLKYALHRLGIIETPLCRRPLATLCDRTSGRLATLVDALAHDRTVPQPAH
ncbi:N-acetylneuraminate lyase [Acuticoccus kandeliae]|uniref:N-acetylneuraminate lyase n=1 Tax=Acuticoccus kandeliae TaxID=2073160 RepID=UPI00196A54B4|nr:N-acetylneuraminate lyase [Acuticoccus kandeliae]